MLNWGQYVYQHKEKLVVYFWIYLNSSLRQVQSLRQFLSGVHIRVMRLGKSFFKLIHLIQREFCATSSWLSAEKQFLITSS